MIIKNKKRGQLFLAAAVIIIIILIGFFTIKNYARQDVRLNPVYDLGEELNIETGNVYDYGIYNEKDKNLLMDNWTDKYIDYSKNSLVENWIFAYGNKKEIRAVTFSTKITGQVGFKTGEENMSIEITKGIKNKTIISKENKGDSVEVTFNNFTYYFKLKKGENFFFVIGSENYVFEN
ncbi:MAG: hypothetical protein KJ559_03425 [Nanoarchaeota archaeon]|nr:hypothetical protein [Nanoarchaeota archaeon]